MLDKIKKLNLLEFICYVLLFLISILFIVYYSTGTSILYHRASNDADIFKLIGRAWYYGYIPYKDIFDHKGPVVYFLNMIGYAFTAGKSSLGIMILQMIFMYASLIGIFKISKLFVKNNSLCFFITLITLYSIKNIAFFEGNKCEEWCMPFISWSFYYILKYFLKSDLNYKHYLFFGISTGICIMTKFTCIVSIIFLIGFIYLDLFINKNNNLLKFILYFLLGNAIIILPFIIYFAINNALYDMIYDGFIFQISYGKAVVGLGETDIDYYIKYYYPLYLMYPALALRYKNYEKKMVFAMSTNIILVSIIFVFVFWKSAYYVYIVIPHLPYAISEIYNFIISKINNNTFKKVFAYVVCILLFIPIVIQIKSYRGRYQSSYSEYEKIIKFIGRKETVNLLTFGMNVGEANYFSIYQGVIKPYYKYYFNQQWFAGFNDKIKDDIIKTYSRGDLRYILTKKENDDLIIKDILDTRYEKIFETELLNLYELTDK